jgi:hypothetical protein
MNSVAKIRNGRLEISAQPSRPQSLKILSTKTRLAFSRHNPASIGRQPVPDLTYKPIIFARGSPRRVRSSASRQRNLSRGVRLRRHVAKLTLRRGDESRPGPPSALLDPRSRTPLRIVADEEAPVVGRVHEQKGYEPPTAPNRDCRPMKSAQGSGFFFNVLAAGGTRSRPLIARSAFK